MNISASSEALVPLLRELTEQYARELFPFIRGTAKARMGREVLGSVPDRPETEDVHAAIDRICHMRFLETCRQFEARGLRVQLVSEHPEDDPAVHDPNIICYLDPFDGTDQFLKGLWEAWYSVFSFTTPDGQTLFGGCVDLVTGILYTANALEKRVVREFLDDGNTSEATPLEERELSGESVVASYKGRWRYLAPWFAMLEEYLGRERFAGITHYSWGGSFVYALLAAGVLSVYIMMREPTDEIRPGRAFVAAADLCLYSVTESGIMRLFRWTQKRRVTFFVAAPNRELAQSIIDGVWGRDEEAVREQKGWLARLMRFLSRPLMRGINGP